MKKLLILLAILAAFPLKAEFSGTRSRLVIPVSQFRAADDIGNPLTVSSSTVTYLAYPAATKQQAIVFPSPATTPPAITASFYTPNDVIGGVPGNGKLFALVHLTGVTGTAQLGVTTIQSSEFGSVTTVASYTGVTFGAGVLPIPSTASARIVRYEMQTVSSTATAPLPFQPNRLVHVSVVPVASTTQDIEFYGLVFEYTNDPKRKR